VQCKELQISLKDKEFLHELSPYFCLKKDAALCRWSCFLVSWYGLVFSKEFYLTGSISTEPKVVRRSEQGVTTCKALPVLDQKQLMLLGLEILFNLFSLGCTEH
jgi:hypothetical protein